MTYIWCIVLEVDKPAGKSIGKLKDIRCWRNREVPKTTALGAWQPQSFVSSKACDSLDIMSLVLVFLIIHLFVALRSSGCSLVLSSRWGFKPRLGSMWVLGNNGAVRYPSLLLCEDEGAVHS